MFDTAAYLRTYYTEMDSENEELIRFWNQMPCSGKVLEIGCGPTIFTAIPLVMKSREFMLTDAYQENLDEIRRWQSGNPDSHDWTPVIEHYLENYIVEESQSYSEEFLVKQLLAAGTDIMDLQKPETMRVVPMFDTIVSAFCLEVAAQDEADFKAIMQRIMRMANPNAMFGLVIITDSEAYTINGTRHNLTNISEKCVFEAFDECDIGVMHSSYIPIAEDRAYKNIFTIYGRKYA